MEKKTMLEVPVENVLSVEMVSGRVPVQGSSAVPELETRLKVFRQCLGW